MIVIYLTFLSLIIVVKPKSSKFKVREEFKSNLRIEEKSKKLFMKEKEGTMKS